MNQYNLYRGRLRAKYIYPNLTSVGPFSDAQHSIKQTAPQVPKEEEQAGRQAGKSM